MDPALAHAAQVLVQTALKLRPGARVVVVEDATSVLLGDAIAGAVEAGGAGSSARGSISSRALEAPAGRTRSSRT
jgi:hypothetical protein